MSPAPIPFIFEELLLKNSLSLLSVALKVWLSNCSSTGWKMSILGSYSDRIRKLRRRAQQSEFLTNDPVVSYVYSSLRTTASKRFFLCLKKKKSFYKSPKDVPLSAAVHPYFPVFLGIYCVKYPSSRKTSYPL